MTENIVKSSDEIRLQLIFDAFERGMRFESISPDAQIAPWLINGLRRLGMGVKLTTDDIKELDMMGGTDHPDPWFK